MRKIVLICFLGLLAACGGEKEAEEQPTFTQDRPSFTGDRSSETESVIRFTDVTESAGIDFIHENGAFGQKWMPETIGSGGGFFHYDDDGYPDLLLVNSTEWAGHESGNPPPTLELYQNQGDGTFTSITKQANLDFSIYGMGAAFADFDADGDTDVYLTAVGNNRLLRNDNGVFTDVTTAMNATGNDPASDAPAWSTSAAWVDVDRDGWLDLFVANYVKWTPETDIYVTRDGKTKSYATPEGYKGESSRLYRNINGKRFEDITQQAGLQNEEGKSLGVAIADFNQDGWPDLTVSNDTQPNFLYINNGDGTFTDNAIPAGIGYDETGRARAGMGIDVVDVANDGNLAVAIGNFSKEPTSLYTQIGTGELFQDRAGSARLTRPSLLMLTFGVLFADLDLDGYQDLIAANGHIEPEINVVQQDITFEQKPQVFKNQAGRFVDVSEQAGPDFATPIVARGIATADIDQDNDLDVLLTVNDGPPRLLRNDSELDGVQRLNLQLQGASPNLDGIGAQITVWTDGTPQRRMIRTGSSYLTQSDHTQILIGLGDQTMADSVVVEWPSGRFSRLFDVNAGQKHRITE